MNKKQLIEQYNTRVNGLKKDIEQLKEINEMELATELELVLSHNYMFSSDQNVIIKAKTKELHKAIVKATNALVKW